MFRGSRETEIPCDATYLCFVHCLPFNSKLISVSVACGLSYLGGSWAGPMCLRTLWEARLHHSTCSGCSSSSHRFIVTFTPHQGGNFAKVVEHNIRGKKRNLGMKTYSAIDFTKPVTSHQKPTRFAHFFLQFGKVPLTRLAWVWVCLEQVAKLVQREQECNTIKGG